MTKNNNTITDMFFRVRGASINKRFGQFSSPETDPVAKMREVVDSLNHIANVMQPFGYDVQPNYEDQIFYTDLQQLIANVYNMSSRLEDLQESRKQRQVEESTTHNVDNTYSNNSSYGDFLQGNY